MECTKTYRGGKLPKPKKFKLESTPDLVVRSVTSADNIKKWHEFYTSVKDNPIFSYYPNRKRIAISLFSQGMKKYNMDVEEIIALVENNPELRNFDKYMDYMKLDTRQYGERKNKRADRLRLMSKTSTAST
jgi:hypothetical protein